ncbi:hypothetical protein BDW59DRAFT_179913 [Aspergillus cavernicola]|uniref:Peptidase S8/S53 domain-containing protein n=1 Tax=Aspergillus cavernicola TaxID=176166 RepID=A0ABR4ICA2_9EURO
MEEDELWLSEEESEDEDPTDARSFTMAFTYQVRYGPWVEFRTRNRPGERQRPHVSVFKAGPRKKPAFTVSCNAKAMIHGELGGASLKMATLLVYEFRFRSYRGARIKEADILFEFKPQPGTTGGISVAKVRPDGVHKMEKSDQMEGHSVWAGINSGLLEGIGPEVGAEYSVEKVAKYHTVITGDRPQDDWGDYYEARFSLSENESEQDGIPSTLTACILLERDDDQDFVCVPTVSIKPNFLTKVATLFSTRDPDDPVYFSVEEPPFDVLEWQVSIDRTNIGATDLDGLWDFNVTEDFADLDLGDDLGPLPDNERRKDWTEVVHLLETGKADWDSLDNEDKLSLAYHDEKNTARPTFLHKMAENWESGEFRGLSRDTREKIVLFLLDEAIPHADKRDDPILTVAIGYYKTDFIEFIIAHRPEFLRTLLMSTDMKGMNCLHKAFKDTLLAAWKELINRKRTDRLASTMSTIMRLLEDADVAPIIAKDDVGNTPIHYAMDYRLCHIPGEYRYNGKVHRYEDIIRLLLKKAESAMKKVGVLFNNRHQSPYRYHSYVRAGIENQSRKEKNPQPSEKEAKSKGRENIKVDHHRYPGKGAGKQTVGEPSSRTPVTAKEDSLQVPFAFPSKANVPPAPKGGQKLARGPQHRPGSPVTPRMLEKESHLGEPKVLPLSRRPTTASDSKGDETEHKVVPDPTKPTNPAKPEIPKSASTAEAASWPGEEEKEAAASIVGFLKCFFIRNSSDRNAKDLLYGKIASDINLFFDASHLRGKKVDDVVRLIELVSKAGGFEDTLSYVKIPQLASETPGMPKTQPRQSVANEKRQLKRGSVGKEAKGRETLVKVFDKLVEVNVRRVLRLHVEDNADEWAHADTAIEQAIKGYSQYSGGIARESLEVGEWDWCKPDINLDVIKYAAPAVEHIHLHWSGNQTVLYGWASSENGIPLMCRNTRSSLSQITLHAYQVTPKLLSRSAVVSARSDGEQDPLLGEQSEKPRSDAWIEAMERFRKALMGMHRSGLLAEPRRVKVALIDDGIDLDDFNTYDTARYTGVSYCSGHGRDEDAWWKSTDGHGTIMANMISRINPWVALVVIKIQSSPSYIHGEGARSISPKSAADAINAAVMHGADIISMSWTITDLEYRMSLISDNVPDEEGKKKRADQTDLHLLRTAITEAVKNDKRLLICSAADDVRLIGDNTLPYSQAPGQILRIGSAGPHANRDPGSGSGGSITYYLPGNQVAEEQRAHSVKPIVYHNGSSVSTALAAGLASFIMYCAHCLDSCGTGNSRQGRARALRNHTNMRKAFSSINRYLEWKDDEKMVPVWGIFGDKGSLLDKANSGQEKIKVLENLVTYLCQDVNTGENDPWDQK